MMPRSGDMSKERKVDQKMDMKKKTQAEIEQEMAALQYTNPLLLEVTAPCTFSSYHMFFLARAAQVLVFSSVDVDLLRTIFVEYQQCERTEQKGRKRHDRQEQHCSVFLSHRLDGESLQDLIGFHRVNTVNTENEQVLNVDMFVCGCTRRRLSELTWKLRGH